MDSADARARWELENNIVTGGPDPDAVYHYDEVQQHAIQQQKLWNKARAPENRGGGGKGGGGRQSWGGAPSDRGLAGSPDTAWRRASVVADRAAGAGSPWNKREELGRGRGNTRCGDERMREPRRCRLDPLSGSCQSVAGPLLLLLSHRWGGSAVRGAPLAPRGKRRGVRGCVEAPRPVRRRPPSLDVAAVPPFSSVPPLRGGGHGGETPFPASETPRSHSPPPSFPPFGSELLLHQASLMSGPQVMCSSAVRVWVVGRKSQLPQAMRQALGQPSLSG